MASTENAPAICSLRTIKSDVVAGIPEGVGERLDEEEPGWKISGKYVRGIRPVGLQADQYRPSFFLPTQTSRLDWRCQRTLSRLVECICVSTVATCYIDSSGVVWLSKSLLLCPSSSLVGGALFIE